MHASVRMLAYMHAGLHACLSRPPATVQGFMSLDDSSPAASKLSLSSAADKINNQQGTYYLQARACMGAWPRAAAVHTAPQAGHLPLHFRQQQLLV